ncbi:hypothetical protein Marpi_0931 [Marinitoga piezophila KA3]|uniref:Uncharacterized protein n=1 Tax=Marinitoga piezophila (strain DSM 14283 / JCM 11233 / KA3) TaxID=443254 RepID=H2J7K3_MARPK|nr:MULTISPECIES: hypothetical protein [Marinitoga]AEX85344.1 hypothetical protein Marpi_0931 [Marinitoga piezophila KA3]
MKNKNKKIKILEIGSYNIEEPNFCKFCKFCSPIGGKIVLVP